MALLEVKDLSMSYAEKQLYSEASFQLNKGEHMGIVGQNGAGKSTLIKILTGKVLPLNGQILWQKNLKVGYLDQYADIPTGMNLITFLHTAFNHLYDLERQMTEYYSEYAQNLDERLLQRAGKIQEQLDSANFYELDTEIERIISGLGLEAIGRDHMISEMSGGQRSKIILAKLLLENDDVIILDEPTNYLDTNHIEWLIEFLQSFAGAAIIISHDYDFLEQVTNTIADIAFGKITKYRGSFQQAMRQKTEKRDAQMRAFEKQQVEITKAQKFIAKNKAGSKSNQAKSREKMLAKMDIVTPPDEKLRASFNFPYLNSGSQNALTVKNLSVGYVTPLLMPVTFSMSHGQKIVFKGFNGVGKSTLIKSILGIIKPLTGESTFSPSVKVNYFSQDLVWENEQATPLAIMQNAYPLLEPKTIRTRLGAVGINASNAVKPIGLLSGGEQTKVKLALMELTQANFLILDEPTNHLDDDTKKGLKEALQKFSGNLILVSHEASFYQGWIDKELNVEGLSLKNTRNKR
ncbi:ATPase subunit of ABC transporter with duplicated ATPase domains [Weissella beninensis]|uniref:ABC-F family ATP-binding cassette domain-containing protein n=1 Tax=Periweissella beninensis TaxID=504936 RepID=A0ABT0VJ52_9LACO|nr:ABC-F family ATP-binding cassette domain-containing protein [Periweissella beninensis]MBM7544449.1 ATPase subunit of ABC transporter with duplicated ATPase domains [Periweissella beninensis]MCM2437864.1 ABC-F family ATP-binding cassette domain-containing protein [Periweissella beninensis]